MKNQKQLLAEEYSHLLALFGVESRGWDEIHLNFSHYIFCPANQRNLIAEYLIWEEFVERAKKYNFVYYWGIDKFLKEYKNAVYSRVKIDAE